MLAQQTQQTQRTPMSSIMPGGPSPPGFHNAVPRLAGQPIQAPGMPHLNPEAERGGRAMSGLPNAPPNYMSYSSGGSYDDHRYSQYAPADYGFAPDNGMPPRRPGPAQHPQDPVPTMPRVTPQMLDGISAGRTPDTGAAIRPGNPRGWTGQHPTSAPNDPAVEARMREWASAGLNPSTGIDAGLGPDPRTPAPRPGFQVIGGPPASQAPAAQLINSYFSCPACGELAVRVFDTPNRPASCPNGHGWQLQNGQKVFAPAMREVQSYAQGAQ